MKRVTLQAFIALAQLRHFGKVAQHFNTTQSTVSARIQGLERDLGTPLFVRAPGAVALTPNGQELLDHALQVIASMDTLERAAGRDPYRAGNLRLGLSETLASTILPDFVAAFSTAYPEARIEIIVNATGFQRDGLIDRTIDLALLMGPVSHSSIENLPLIDFDLMWAAAPSHPMVGAAQIDVADLKDIPVLSYSTNSRPYLEVQDSLRAAGLKAPRLFSSNALGASVAMTKAGLAVCTLPRVYAAPLLASGEIVELPVPVALSPLRFTASLRAEPGNDLARNASRIAVQVAEAWMNTHREIRS